MKLLETSRLLLKPLTLEFCTEQYVSWLNDFEVNQYLESGNGYTLSMLQDFILNIQNNKIYAWAIVIKDSNKHIGNIKIDPINLRHGFAEYGILLGEKSEWNKGYAKEASQFIIQYCFDELKLRKINLGVVEKNTAAFNLYKSMGFEIEGIYKAHAKYNSEYCDIIRMAIFKNSSNKYE